MILEAGVSDPGDVIVVIEVLRDDGGVLAVFCDAQWQRFQSLQCLPGVEGRLLVAETAQRPKASGGGEGCIREVPREVSIVVGVVLAGNFVVPVFAPRERTTVDQDAADGRSRAV